MSAMAENGVATAPAVLITGSLKYMPNNTAKTMSTTDAEKYSDLLSQ